MRRYESALGIFLRFCELNRISVRRAEGILPIRPHQPYRSPDEEAERLAGVLDEPISVVRTMFLPQLSLDNCGGYSINFLLKERSDKAIRYCPECVRFGYHSVFHEVAWLEKCPFHGMQLKISRSNYGRILDMRILALRRVMRANCQSWPLVANGSTDCGNDDIVKAIVDWADCTSAAAKRLSEMDFFIFGWNAFYANSSFLRRLGQLCEINPPSAAIKPYMKCFDVEWEREYKLFDSLPIRNFTNDCEKISLSILFDFYVKTQVLSPTPPTFVGRYRNMLSDLRNRHATCHCKWLGVTSTNGLISWRKNDSSGKNFDEQCPYEVVFAKLEERWGNWQEVYGKRRARQEFGRLIAVSQNIRDFGFIKLASDRATNRDEYFERLHDLIGNFTWDVDVSIIHLLNTAAMWLIEAEVVTLNTWLSRIDDGGRPPILHIPGEGVHLQNSDAGVRLMRWIFRR
ncbi:TniQ family protein [Burkholderia cenocepacia]|uniref:hypothetical protein n=1 Tax=Burkholderia cenocepacia TaxID=95486 RepID=UPI002AB772E4|nr:hypothetical protein [Burkholderia cenocepacia]